MQLGVCKHLYPQIILMSSQHPSAPAKGNGISKDRFCFYIKRIKLIAEGLEGDR